MPKNKKPKSMISESKAAYRVRTRPDARENRPAGDFWNPLTLNELIKQQRTKPFTAAAVEKWNFWPEGEDVEEFIRAAKGDRYRKN